MSDCMMFPSEWEKFIEDYSFKDKEEVYTNGSVLVPVFRVEQMVEHYFNNAWIPVTERLPEYDGTYLVFTTSGTVTTARWYGERDMRNYRGDFICHMEGRFHRNVTHWMPLPEPPKEE